MVCCVRRVNLIWSVTMHLIVLYMVYQARKRVRLEREAGTQGKTQPELPNANEVSSVKPQRAQGPYM